MAGQLIQKGERTWLIRVYMGRDGNGKPQYPGVTFHGRKKEAESHLHRLLVERDSGTYRKPTKMSLGAYLDQWLAAKSWKSERTKDDYTALLSRYVRPALGSRRLDQLSPLDIQALYESMKARGLSGRTLAYTHTVLSSALKQARRWRPIAVNPAEDVERPSKDARHDDDEHEDMRVLSLEEAERFLAAAEGDRWGVLFKFALATGMRPGEYRALKWSDVAPDFTHVRVQRAISEPKRGWKIDRTKTKQSRRTIPLPPETALALAEHRRRQAEVRLAHGPGYADLDLVFANRDGRPLNENNLVNRHFKHVLRAARLDPKLRLYDLRHTCATMLLADGENVKTVSERLGHASIVLTLQTYAHVLPTMQQGAADRLQRILFGGRHTAEPTGTL